jgi:ABC-2 type transport system permease protein
MTLELAMSRPSRAMLEWATIRVLWWRDVVRFFRQPSRVIGALAQPILFWWVIGSGFSGSFRATGDRPVAYMAFFYPGVLAMVILFSAIFATITVVEDRKEGFLQAVLAGPGSRLAAVLGKVLGSSTVGLMQAGLFLILAPWAGIQLSDVNPLLLVAVMVLTALAMTSLGVTLAWWVRSTSGYHAVMSVLLIPMWVLSGGMFPREGAGHAIATLMGINPLRFTVDGLRRALCGDAASPAASPLCASTVTVLTVLGLFSAGFFVAASVSVSRRE